MTHHLDDLLQREVSRKEFLSTIGIGLASVMGLSALMRLTGHKGSTAHKTGYGYGGSAYGR